MTLKSTTPVLVSGIADATAVTVGENYACALLSGGQIDCWGGETGHAGLGGSPTPVVVGVTGPAISVSAAHIVHTCAAMTSGGVECWGAGPFGQLGNDSIENSWTPSMVRGLPSAAISAGGGSFYTCALLANGEIDCWGSNSRGDLGDGTTEESLTPVKVLGIE